MSDDKVIHAFPTRELPECPVSIERRSSYCQHPTITLVPHDRAVICAKCGAALDAFDYLMKEAQAIRYGWETYRQVIQLVQEKRQQVADLDREKKRLQGRIRTLNLRGKKD